MKMITRNTAPPCPVPILLFVVVLTLPAQAHQGATGIVKDRMEHMKTIAQTMKRLGATIQGKTPYDPGAVQSGAQTLANKAGAEMTRLFPSDTLDHPSEATPTIWVEWPRFEALALDMRARANDLAGAAVDNGAARAAFKDLAATCKACHQDFRLKKQD